MRRLLTIFPLISFLIALSGCSSGSAGTTGKGGWEYRPLGIRMDIPAGWTAESKKAVFFDSVTISRNNSSDAGIIITGPSPLVQAYFRFTRFKLVDYMDWTLKTFDTGFFEISGKKEDKFNGMPAFEADLKLSTFLPGGSKVEGKSWFFARGKRFYAVSYWLNDRIDYGNTLKKILSALDSMEFS
ncbi:MAG: hypothetical protein HQL30_07605 [Candidatus Omnitrophica bacterium]|nr:hypothetical protein [Candidatus Omnitrophota bacterium]